MGDNFTVALVANKNDVQETPAQRFEIVCAIICVLYDVVSCHECTYFAHLPL